MPQPLTSEPGPLPLTDLDAYALIAQVRRGDELHPSAVRALAEWADARDERVKELEEALRAADKHIDEMNERAA